MTAAVVLGLGDLSPCEGPQGLDRRPGGRQLLLGPLSFRLETASRVISGSLPTAGPSLGASTGPGGRAGGPGGLLQQPEVSSELVSVLSQDAGDFTWIAAGIGSQTAAGYQLASGYPVMAIGGFNGSDPSPTLEQFQQYVAEGRIHYFIVSDIGGPGGGGGSAISTWVQENFDSSTVDGVTLYDLSA